MAGCATPRDLFHAFSEIGHLCLDEMTTYSLNASNRPKQPNLSLTTPISKQPDAMKALKPALVFSTEEKIVNFDNGFVWVHDGENCMFSFDFYLFPHRYRRNGITDLI